MRTQKDVRILVLFFAVLGVGAGGVSGAFDSLTSRYLCKLQCSTLLADSPNIYSRYSSLCTQPNQQFSFGCQDLGCAGSCDSIILIIHNVNKSASFPLLSARYINKTEILLTWSSPPTPYYTRYLLQYRSYQKWTFVTEGPEMNYTYHNPNPCSPQQFRVIAVNQYGTKGFSNSLTVSAPAPPSAPQNPQLMEDAMFYNPHSKEFAGVLQVEGIQEWKQEDIDYYQWNKLPTIYCKNINSFVVPILDGLSSRDADVGTLHRMGIRIHLDGFDCVYTIQVRAVSKCGVPGPYSNITIDLTDCSKIRNFNCQAWRNRIFNKPGNVENVTLTMDLHHPHIWLKVDWEKPTDMGSMGVISHYVMRWGKVRLPIFELEQPEFTHDPFNTTLPNNIVEFGIQVQEEPHTSYGFQIMPIAPTQVLRPSEYDMYQIFDITLKNRTSCQNNNIPASRISCDEDGVTVVHFSNTLDITVIWRVSGHSKRETDDKQGFDDKEFYEKYAIQLGEVKHVPPPVGLQLVKANVTVVESVCEERRPSFTLCIPERDTIQYKNLQPEVLYGIRVIGLKKSEALPTEKRWRMKKVHTFVLNKTTEVLNTTLSTAISRDHVDYILVIVGVPIALLVVLLLLCCILRRRKKRELSSLDSHLLFGEASPDNPYNQIERAMRTATTLTVVADKWEIPHDCVRIGRMLGSGAFGYVVKGRINRSILRHRGIKEPFVADRKNMYVSVAVKLIQEEASETKKEEFLREIRLMKGIGYHNNVISMLGCCTLHDPICLIVEHATHGDLLSYLRNIRQRIQQSKINAEYVNQEIETVSPQELLSFARQISTGMEFLSQKGFIHRDLAARNILVDKKNLVKIGDFGLTRYTYDNKVYVNRKGGRLPLKWMSIEAINELTFSSASDVWSFGVLLFEIVTLGGTPYPTIDTRELLRELKNGYRMEKPENCSEEMQMSIERF
ncbi:uncharacterized protein LOC125649973 isoform X2 [Ostrea edulis]|uniref:uncharacterized protein LOC125649973 isoform X2 n=1 Tax=Ostrea edulis TaxID=37623 RepID=UPI0024AF7F1A|nr:uncharacterized protein LOC125649973 isoform X2 [Ostrea edulis]